MTTHVFIVDATTFPLHLNYRFAGTGAGDKNVDFNNRETSSLHATTERNLVSMVADANRIRKGDQIIFYLQQNYQQDISEGRFLGVFEATDDGAFLDANGSHQYLANELGKSLTFRTLFAPLNVYAEGVTEWEALDEIKNIKSPHQMLWSLIYRKLKGNRGNTMITEYEAERLIHLIRTKNKRRELTCSGTLSLDLDSDPDNPKIVCIDESAPVYSGRQESIEIFPRLQAKHARGNQFEAHLQAYITQHIGRNTNKSLDAAVFGQGQVEWLGNEVSCGVGMQRIDVMLSVVHDRQRTVIPIELKSGEASIDNLRQLQRYVDWVQQYYIPNQFSDIQPTLLTKKIEDKSTSEYAELVAAFNEFNAANSTTCKPLRYIEFQVGDGNISFRLENY